MQTIQIIISEDKPIKEVMREEKISPASFIDPNIFIDKSLKDTIEKMSNPDSIIDEKEVINLIVKYFFAFLYPESIDCKVKLSDINDIFGIAHSYFKILKNQPNERIPLKDNKVSEILKFINKNCYPLVMLGDIASTTSIVSSIIKTVILPEIHDNKYTGLDLGTGTGILLLAQYIQARRNGFHDIKNIGIDIVKEACHSSDVLLKKIGAGEVIEGDTTKSRTYKGLFRNRVLTHISNETIPSNGISMTGENDPFHQNNETIFTALKDNISSNTQFFPKQIEMILSINKDKTSIVGGPENKFCLEPLLELEQMMLKSEGITFPDGWRVFNELTANAIDIAGKKVILNKVGKHLEYKGFVKPLKYWKRRWV